MQGDRVHVTGEVRGLTPNSEHGFHIHEKGDLSAPDLASAGAHYNPTGHKHGGPESQQKHVGDLGNIRADGQGVARVDRWVENATLEAKNAIVGRSILVHAQADDLKSDPSGNSGGRIAGGVIEMKK
jgi:Cu-Zn family superoxide dismutase